MEVEVVDTFNVENPLHVDNIPVANLVIIEVDGQPILDPKSQPILDTCIKLWNYVQICGSVFILFGMLGGVLLFIIWLYNPFLFEKQIDDD
jgi:hypothetical protein